MSNKPILIPIDTTAPYQRFITGQGGIRDITNTGDVVSLPFNVPPQAALGNFAKIQYAEYQATSHMRWVRVSIDGKLQELPPAISGTLNFLVTSAPPDPASNAIPVMPGTQVGIEIFESDPAAPKPPKPCDPRTMVFDWSKTWPNA